MKIIYVFLFSIAFAASAWGQAQHGTIDCQDKTGIQALEQPGSLIVIRQLSCDQSIEILELVRGYVKVRINDKLVGFVEAKYVRSGGMDPGKTAQHIAELEAQIKELNEKTQSASTQTSGSSRPWLQPLSPIKQERFSRMEAFGRYSILRPFLPGNLFTNSADNEIAKQTGEFMLGNIIGWGAGFTANLNEHVGITADFSGYYKNLEISYEDTHFDAGGSLHTFLFGPTLNTSIGKTKPFVRALFGVGKISASANGSVEDMSAHSEYNKTGFAAAIGGGVDIPIGDRISLRAIEFDYFPYRHSDGRVFTFNNIRWGSGLVFGF
jgi:hypothetical protein